MPPLEASEPESGHCPSRGARWPWPNGSVRGLLALLAVGTFVLVLADAAHEHFEHVATAFGTLTGAMIGFYFGTRTAQKKGDLPGDKP